MLSVLLPAITSVLDKVLPDPQAAAEAKLKALAMAQQGEFKEIDAEVQIALGRADIIKAEISGESYLQKNWRPILMLSIVAIIANNYLLAPYINALFGAGSVPVLELPERLWDLMILGVGGYITGRSGEKMVKAWKGKE